MFWRFTQRSILDLFDFASKKNKIKERRMNYISFFEKKQKYFFQCSVQHYIALIKYSHRQESRWSL